jgi:hypothetical protein
MTTSARVNTFQSVGTRFIASKKGDRGPLRYRVFANMHGKGPRSRRGGGGEGLGGDDGPSPKKSLLERVSPPVPTPWDAINRVPTAHT